jgi:hypothetical protein
VTAVVVQGIEFLLGLGFLVAGLTVVRKASGKAGFAMAAAGFFQLASVCCLTTVRVAIYPEPTIDVAGDVAAMIQGWSWLLASLVDLVSAILVAVALVMLAKAVKRTRGVPDQANA